MAFQPAPEPNSNLGWHRVLSPTAGVRVSPLCLGTMSFGEAWKSWAGECDKSTSFEILDTFLRNGGNFLDTSSNYQDQDSEQWVGEWMESRGVREEMVVATKYSIGGFRDVPVAVNHGGNHTKNMFSSLETSLKNLKTSYVDILYLHYWDFTTSIPEIMKSLNTLCDQGKVLYLGVSDVPAWIVSKANQYARDHGLRQFVIYQGRWNAAARDMEREILPMAADEGMALAPWNALGAGAFKSEAQRANSDGRKQLQGISDADAQISKVLEKLANEKGNAITSIALAYLMHKTPNVYPIIGGRKVEHLIGNIKALSVRLTSEEMEEIEEAVPFDHGFPMNFLFAGMKTPSLKGSDVFLTKMNSRIDVVDRLRPIEPRPLKT